MRDTRHNGSLTTRKVHPYTIKRKTGAKEHAFLFKIKQVSKPAFC